jgi:nucleoside-diphosphate-sugar epimerase
VDTVFHLAGYAHDLRDASKLEAVYRSINVDATMRLANACVANGVRRFVFVSSVKAGGPSIGSQARGEGEHYTPEGIYGQTKREAELKLLALAKASGMEVSILRPCLVFGPGVKGNLRSMLTGIEQGWLPPLPGAHNRRSLIHVDDVVRALRLVAHHEDAKGEIFIATGARDYSTQAIYRTLCEVAGKRPPQWSVPKILFDLLARAHPKLDEKVSKLFGDAQYYSTKLQSIGFEAHRDLREIHETMY